MKIKFQSAIGQSLKKQHMDSLQYPQRMLGNYVMYVCIVVMLLSAVSCKKVTSQDIRKYTNVPGKDTLEVTLRGKTMHDILQNVIADLKKGKGKRKATFKGNREIDDEFKLGLINGELVPPVVDISGINEDSIYDLQGHLDRLEAVIANGKKKFVIGMYCYDFPLTYVEAKNTKHLEIYHSALVWLGLNKNRVIDITGSTLKDIDSSFGFLPKDHLNVLSSVYSLDLSRIKGLPEEVNRLTESPSEKEFHNEYISKKMYEIYKQEDKKFKIDFSKLREVKPPYKDIPKYMSRTEVKRLIKKLEEVLGDEMDRETGKQLLHVLDMAMTKAEGMSEKNIRTSLFIHQALVLPGIFDILQRISKMVNSNNIKDKEIEEVLSLVDTLIAEKEDNDIDLDERLFSFVLESYEHPSPKEDPEKYISWVVETAMFLCKEYCFSQIFLPILGLRGLIAESHARKIFSRELGIIEEIPYFDQIKEKCKSRNISTEVSLPVSEKVLKTKLSQLCFWYMRPELFMSLAKTFTDVIAASTSDLPKPFGTSKQNRISYRELPKLFLDFGFLKEGSPELDDFQNMLVCGVSEEMHIWLALGLFLLITIVGLICFGYIHMRKS